jgi:hypothetical protein
MDMLSSFPESAADLTGSAPYEAFFIESSQNG